MHNALRVALFAALCLVIFTLPARADVINVGAAFGALEPYVNSLVGLAISALVGWLLYLAKSKLNLSIDDSMRDALQTWLTRQAQSLVADGAVKVSGLTIEVKSAALASAANLAIKEIPDAAKHFGMTPERLAEMIKDKLPAVPAVASAAKPDA